MSQVLLSSAYFAPIQWYQKLNRYDNVAVEAHDSFIKQTYRNRCLIATTAGVQALTVPVERGTDGAADGGGAQSRKCMMTTCTGTRCKAHTESRRSSSFTPTMCARFSSGGGRSCTTSTWKYAQKCAI